ncbi:alpha/beta hydrolase [Alistipes sp.]|uniref:alpha/beta hydrolase n=1 Tax=Alistipes sp. TaxID=1872444 RepID=UPI003A85C80E
MKRLFTLAALAAALTASAEVRVVKLWDNASAPHSNGITAPETEERGRISNIVETELHIYPAARDKATGQAVVVCPGGGYRLVAMQREGDEVGEWLSAEGITVVALKYRLPNGHREVPLEDTEAALRYIRDHAGEYGVDPARVGIMGFSAGGHLAGSAATMLPEAVRPAFAVLIYPVITAEPGKCHKGSFDHLLGTGRTADDEERWSLQNRVTATTPPTLLILADDDRTVPPVNSTLFYEALKRNGVKGCSLHIYPEGGHGGGFHPSRAYRNAWRADVLDWLATLPAPAAD